MPKTETKAELLSKLADLELRHEQDRADWAVRQERDRAHYRAHLAAADAKALEQSREIKALKTTVNFAKVAILCSGVSPSNFD